MPARILAGARCVQRFDDSLNSAIHITYRISLRSSSMPEPRDPLLKVLTYSVQRLREAVQVSRSFVYLRRAAPSTGAKEGPPRPRPGRPEPAEATVGRYGSRWCEGVLQLCNDPSAGSPTETLLRLLLPLNDRVWITFRP